MSKRQHSIVKDIEKKLGVKCYSATQSGMDKFIKKYYNRLMEHHRKVGDDTSQFEMTTKQKRFISYIESVLNIKFDGSTIGEASQFIEEHLDEFNKQK